MITIVVSATVVTDDPGHAARAAEVLARAAAGLVLEGITVSVSMAVPDEDT
ncbi:MAG TPA: hypothetical protein VFC00_30000 [Micromonosporaceae bacterium]|nr:hypothetical protein [Micromonosporaceae bacterium]